MTFCCCSTQNKTIASFIDGKIIIEKSLWKKNKNKNKSYPGKKKTITCFIDGGKNHLAKINKLKKFKKVILAKNKTNQATTEKSLWQKINK